MGRLSNIYVVFDLDDTLYSEEDFLLSAYQHIAGQVRDRTGRDPYDDLVRWRAAGGVPLDLLLEHYPEASFTIAELLELYRYHEPIISLRDGAMDVIKRLTDSGAKVGILTDGRSRSQRNKLRALGVLDLLNDVVISEEIGSEKPDEANYLAFESAHPGLRYVYVGDNLRKDFITPKRRGWLTVGLRNDGRNIHTQDLTLPPAHHPHHFIDSLRQLPELL